MDRRNRELIGLWAQNPISRRSLLGAVTLSVIASSSIGKALGVTAPVINQILGRPTDSSIAVSVLSSSPISAYIEYGISKTKYTVKSSTLEISPTAPSVFDLRGLRSSTKIYYRVRFKTADQKVYSSGKQYSFTTAKKPGSTFSFSIHGDTHPERAGKMFNAELYSVTLANIASQQPDFHILMGDDFSIDPLISKGQATKENVEKIYNTHRTWLSATGASVPIFLVNGNHEQAAAYLLDGSQTSPAVLAGNARLKYYPLPAPDNFYSGNTTEIPGVGLPRDYYSWTWGDALCHSRSILAFGKCSR